MKYFLILFLTCSIAFGAKVPRDNANKHASQHESSGNDTVDHDLLSGFVADEHLDWTSDQGATNIDDNNVPHTALTSNPHTVTKSQVSLGNVPDLKQNLSASVAPGASDDTGAGYAVGSSWIDTTADKTYMCTDATAAAAVWKDTSASGGADADAIHDNVASEISAITEKTVPVSGDFLIIEDSAASNVKKRVQIGNLPSSGAPVSTVQTTDATTTTIKTFTAGTDFNNDDVVMIEMDCQSTQNDGSKGAVIFLRAAFRKDGAATTVRIGSDVLLTNLADTPQAYSIGTVLSGSNILAQVTGASGETVEHRCETTIKTRNAT